MGTIPRDYYNPSDLDTSHDFHTAVEWVQIKLQLMVYLGEDPTGIIMSYLLVPFPPTTPNVSTGTPECTVT